METNNLISANQHAYRKDHCTGTANIDMTGQWLEQTDLGKSVGDLVDCSILFKKLSHYGFQKKHP